MLRYNLTQRERQLLVRLLELCENTKDHFEATIIEPGGVGPSAELAQIDFGGEGHSMQLTRRDLRVLKDEGLIYFRWDLPEHGTGRLSTLALEAVRDNFQATDSGAAEAAAASAAKAVIAADEKAIVMRFEKITADLVSLIGRLIDDDEASAAGHEASSIAAELNKPVPDETIITRKTKGFASRLALTFSGTADLAAKG